MSLRRRHHLENTMNIWLRAVFLWFLLWSCAASDVLPEWRIEQAVAGQQAKEVVWLDADQNRFFGLFTDTPATAARGAALILPDADANPDWAKVVRPLRLGLPELGWISLGLQLPVRQAETTSADYTTLLPEAEARIQAGLNFLQSKPAPDRVLIGYGFGALALVHFLARQPATSVRAAVIINIPVPIEEASQSAVLSALGKLSLPLLDIDERPATLLPSAARDRRLAQKQNGAYRQLLVEDMDLTDEDLEDALVKRVHGWLVRATSPAR
jgi:hypothetical protein